MSGVVDLIALLGRLQRKTHKNQIVNVLRLLADDPFTPSLKSHKLTGNLAGLWSCSVAYDCRIIFNFSEDEKLLEMVILLIDIDSHDEVY
ncbi:MAG: type II toxin-antitoxin system YafQ family toxin [Nostoc sp.]|uniref:type II toxin-antitoxin system RelE/ParE family toxin n=1 Tax=Nostoc sp. TaxID=1180 RepID=UPI002FFB5BE0